ncbi:MAG: DNA polymerase III subunit beta [Pirellulales bacterium]|nr:DNA polymerase III subunit beta [Pirellulales bacterium]
MKIKIERDKFQAAFQTAASVAPARSPKPILQNIKLEATGEEATLMATDLEVGIRIAVPGLVVETPGSILLSVPRVGQILREATGEQLSLESDGQSVIIRGDRSEWKLPTENPDEFPTVILFQEEKFHEVSARLFRELVRRTIFATDNESSRYALGGVLLEMSGGQIIGVGTDGRRLAKMEGPAQAIGGHETGPQTTIIPTKAMTLLERAIADSDGEVQISARPNDVLVRTPRLTVYSRLVEGRFPKWRDVFPQRSDATKVELAVGPTYAAVRQAAIATSEESRGVDFTFGGGTLTLTGRAADVGQSRVEIPIAYDGPEITIALDPKFVNDFLKVLDPGKTLTLELKDADSAAVCHTDDGYGYVIMPLARDR